MIQTLLSLSRKNKKSLMLLFDFIAVIFSIFAAFSIRLGYFYYPTGDNNLLLIMIASVARLIQEIVLLRHLMKGNNFKEREDH